MNELPQSLKDTAKSALADMPPIHHPYDAFCIGVQWLFDYLMKSELEFDEKAAKDAGQWIFEFTVTHPFDLVFKEGARWQFEQLKGRLLLYHYGADEMIRTIQEQQARIAALEATITALKEAVPKICKCIQPYFPDDRFCAVCGGHK